MAKKKSKKGSASYKAYQTGNRSQVNRTKKLERHCKKFPDDKQAAAALKKGVVQYRRQTPSNKIWSTGTKMYAEQLRRTGSKGHLAIMSKDEFEKRYKKKS